MGVLRGFQIGGCSGPFKWELPQSLQLAPIYLSRDFILWFRAWFARWQPILGDPRSCCPTYRRISSLLWHIQDHWITKRYPPVFLSHPPKPFTHSAVKHLHNMCAIMCGSQTFTHCMCLFSNISKFTVCVCTCVCQCVCVFGTSFVMAWFALWLNPVKKNTQGEKCRF